MKILLACALGCTTSLLVEKMKQVANEDDVVEAQSVTEVKNIYKNYDVVLLGPQVRLQADDLTEICEKDNVKVDVIDFAAYGRIDGVSVYNQAKKLVEEV
jgi:PTS system cellobiose-specific IIB component